MIEPSYYWNNVVLLALGTLAIRGSIIAISGRVKIPERLRELFSYIPAAILPAFIAPAVYFHEGNVGWLFGKERCVVLVLAAVICYFSRSTLATIMVGLAALYTVTYVI